MNYYSVIDDNVRKFEKKVKEVPKLISEIIMPLSPDVANFIASIDIDSPVILTFSFICFVVHCITSFIKPNFSLIYCSVFSFYSHDFKLFSLLTLFKQFSHIIGHSSWDHLYGNLVHILLVGPSCEKEYGPTSLLGIILLTAITSGLAHNIIGQRNSCQLGASGIVFMLILLNSLSDKKSGKMPFTFILQASIWIWKEVIAGLFYKDSTSHHAHLVGAAVGL